MALTQICQTTFVILLLWYTTCESSTYNHEISDTGNYIRVGGDTGHNWRESDTYCQSVFGTHLASFHSTSENSDAIANGSWVSTYGQIWIGLNDIDVEGDYVWIDGTPFDYENWEDKQDTISENCVRISVNDGGWNDIACSTLYFGFICNYNPPAGMYNIYTYVSRNTV